jgi:hypothetical protein
LARPREPTAPRRYPQQIRAQEQLLRSPGKRTGCIALHPFRMDSIALFDVSLKDVRGDFPFFHAVLAHIAELHVENA